MFTLTSPAFENGGPIPEQYTCDGADTAPPLEWRAAPAGTRSFALVMDDPGASDPKEPAGAFVHWVLYDIPAAVNVLVNSGSGLPQGTREGTNSFNRVGYGGPCPPSGAHQYSFKLYALDTMSIGNEGAMSRAQVENAIADHVLEKAELVGTYERTRAGKGREATAKTRPKSKARAR